jgi:hypothetical protein
MKRVTTLLTFAALLIACSSAIAAGPLAGTFKTTIGTAPLGGHVKGTWHLTFKNGTYTVTQNTKTMITGKYAINDGRVSLGHEHGPDACSTTGTYKYKITGATLKFTRVSDSSAGCAGRVAVLASTFTKLD